MGKVEDAEATMRRNVEEKTGKPFAAWVALARKQNFAKHSEILAWLKSGHGFSYGYAIALKARESAVAPPAGDDLIADQYMGEKAGLKPIYDALIAVIGKFGSDVEVSPKKAYVSLRRNKQFALIQPSTATRVDVGINLKNLPATKRLEASGSFNAMVSHRVRMASVADIDVELKGWLRKAYDAA